MSVDDLLWLLHELDGFDVEFVGFDCLGEIEPWDWDKPWRCPFQPGCGVTKASDCPLKKQQAQIAHAPRRPQ